MLPIALAVAALGAPDSAIVVSENPPGTSALQLFTVDADGN